MRKEQFSQGEYYHIYSRTLLNAPEFKNAQNAHRLFLAFLAANSTNSDEAFRYIRNSGKDFSFEELVKIIGRGEKLVDIISYSVMPNHYHHLLCEKAEEGIRNFIHKCNTSIAKYVNIRNNRRGPLFESRFQSKHIDSNEYLLHLSLYIHLNPLDIIEGRGWREGKLKDWKNIKSKLLNYPWSSLNFYLNGLDNPVLSGTDIITDQFTSQTDYEEFLKNWSMTTHKDIIHLVLE